MYTGDHLKADEDPNSGQHKDHGQQQQGGHQAVQVGADCLTCKNSKIVEQTSPVLPDGGVQPLFCSNIAENNF
jgi:hypothetical protein